MAHIVDAELFSLRLRKLVEVEASVLEIEAGEVRSSAFTAADAAAFPDISLARFEAWCDGTELPTEMEFIAIASAFGIRMDYLSGERRTDEEALQRVLRRVIISDLMQRSPVFRQLCTRLNRAVQRAHAAGDAAAEALAQQAHDADVGPIIEERMELARAEGFDEHILLLLSRNKRRPLIYARQ